MLLRKPFKSLCVLRSPVEQVERCPEKDLLYYPEAACHCAGAHSLEDTSQTLLSWMLGILATADRYNVNYQGLFLSASYYTPKNSPWVI